MPNNRMLSMTNAYIFKELSFLNLNGHFYGNFVPRDDDGVVIFFYQLFKTCRIGSFSGCMESV